MGFDYFNEIAVKASTPVADGARTTSGRGPEQSGSARSDLRSVLRAETDDDHRALDAFIGPVWENAEAYRGYIAMNCAAHHSLEPAVEAAFAGRGIGLPYEPVRELLDGDLYHLDPSAHRFATATTPTTLSLPAALGAIYVLEGSRLGARMIHTRLKAKAWSETLSTKPFMFFEACRSTTGFASRMAILHNLVEDDDQTLDEAVLGAKKAFAIFRKAAEQATSGGADSVIREDAS